MEIDREGTFSLGGGLTFTSQRSRCLRIFSMTSSSSIKAIIFIFPRHFGQAPLNSEGLFRPPIKHFLLNHGQVTLSGGTRDVHKNISRERGCQPYTLYTEIAVQDEDFIRRFN